MPILNIDQFVERRSETVVNCTRCHSIMQQAPINFKDALKVILGNKKLTGRLRCPDCQKETTIEWKE